MNSFIYYLGLILFVIGLIGFPYMLYKCKATEKDVKSIKEFTILNKYKIGIPALSFYLGFILLNVAFFNADSTIYYLSKNSISVKWYSYLLVYLVGSLLAFSVLYLIYFLYFVLYIDKIKLSKKFKVISLVTSIILILLTFIGYTEGLAPYLMYPLANCLHIGSKGIRVFNYYRYGSEYSSGLNIYLYAIFILSGACLVLYVADYKLYKEYGHHDLITNTFLIGFPSGIIGARLWYVILDISANGSSSIYVTNWLNIFDLRHGGLGIMGGAILGIIAGISQLLVVKYAKHSEKYKEFSILRAIDIIVPCILFAQAIGRIGNFFNNEVYGYLTSTWNFLPSIIKNNMYYDHGGTLSITVDGVKLVGVDALTYYKENNLFYIPLFFVEFVTNLTGYFVLEYGIRKGLKKYHSDCSLLGGYLIWYGLTRLILEPMRTSADYYKTSWITSIFMIVGGLLIVIFFVINNYVFKKKKLLWYKEKEVIKNDKTDNI